MCNLIRADLFKLKRSIMVKVLFCVSCLSAVMMAVFSHLMALGDIGVTMNGVASLFSDFQMMGLLGAVAAGTCICSDFDNKTIHHAVSYGAGRGTVAAGKMLVYLLLVMFMLVPYAVVAIFAFCTDLAFIPFLPSVFLQMMANESAPSGPAFLRAAGVMLTIAVVYAGQLSICVWIAFTLKKAVPVIGVSYGVTVLLAGLANSGTAEELIRYTPFGTDYAALTVNSGAGVWMRSAGISVLFILFMLAFTCLSFRKSEIK